MRHTDFTFNDSLPFRRDGDLRSETEDFRRRCPRRWGCSNKHHSRIEGDASWKETLWRSHWAQNPQSTGPVLRILSRWWSDTGVCRAVAWWIGSDCHFLQKPSWSCNKTRHPCNRLPRGQHPVLSSWNWGWSLPRVQAGGHGRNRWVCDGHWCQSLFRLQFFGKHHYAWVCNSCWG